MQKMSETIEQINKLKDTKGMLEKQEIIANNKDNEMFIKLLFYTLNPLLTYNISEKTLRREVPGAWMSHTYNNIFEICDMLSEKKGVDTSVIKTVASYIHSRPNPDEREIYIKLISKTLRLGITAKTVNKVIPGLIPEWEVQQAYPIDKYQVNDGTEFWLTQKLNGVRATFYNGKLVARSGTPYEGIDHIINEIEKSSMSDYVLDGELTLKDKGLLTDNEAFRMATGILNSDDMNKTAICYTVFDIIPKSDFDSDTPSVPYKARREMLNTFAEGVKPDGCLRILPVLYCGTDQSKINELLERMIAEDKEGLMLNTDVPYKRTRHKGILKIKRFYTMDLEIIGCEEGTGRLEGTLGAFILEYKDNIVKVGSGFTDEQRTEFWNSREDIIGNICEVKYKEISSDKNTGFESLQFPVFVRLRTDKNEISYG